MNIEELSRKSLDYLKSNYGEFPKNGFIAGGSLSNLIWEFVSGNKAKINDIDIFIYKGEYKLENKNINSIWNKTGDGDKVEKLSYISYEKERGPTDPYGHIGTIVKNKDYYRITHAKMDGIFNIIEYKSSTDRPNLILESFDINCVQIGYSIEEDKFYWTEEFEEFLKTGQLKLINFLTPAHSVIRLVKKQDELNCILDPFEIEICKLCISKNFRNINRIHFTDKYVKMFNKYEDILSKHFELRECIETTNTFRSRDELPNITIFRLYSKNICDELNDKSIDYIYDISDIFFYIRKVMNDYKKKIIWSNLKVLYSRKDYVDCEYEINEVKLLARLVKYIPNSVDNLFNLKLSQQLILLNTLLDKFKNNPIIALSILGNAKLDINTKFDDGDLLLLELSVRKLINNDKSIVDRILFDKETTLKITYDIPF